MNNNLGGTTAVNQRIGDFAKALQQLRHEVGRPSYDEIAHHALLTKTTLSRAFGGRTLPSWRTTRGILDACGVDDAERNRWLGDWSEISKLIKGVEPGPSTVESTSKAPSRRSGDDDLVGATCCPDCGAVVVDHDSHRRWHREWVRRPERPLKVVGGDPRTG